MADKLDAAFAQTTKLLFGKPLSPLSKYEEWLRRRVPGGKRIASCFSHGSVYVPQYGALQWLPGERVASEEDLQQASGKRMAGEDYSLAGITARMPEFAYFVPTYSQGRNLWVEDSLLYLDCVNIRGCFDPFTSKNCAFVHSIIEAEGLFGMYRIAGGMFSIHCYNSINVKRCFEIDGGKDCSNCYFCHNAENLENCIFCFNTKGLRYAVGNLEVGKEKFLAFRQEFLSRIVPLLEKEGKLGFDIYDALCAGKRGR